MKASIITLGCRLNLIESESIAASLKKDGFTVENYFSDDTDIVILNSCTVTSKTDQDARRLIRKFAKNTPVIVTGCYANVEKTQIESLSSNVIVVQNKSALLDAQYITSLVSNHNLQNSKSSYNYDPFAFDVSDFSFHSRAMLKIQDGCDNNCSYCLTHIARGKSVSLNPNTVIERIKKLEENGYKEICLTGVNVASYNWDGVNISSLLKKIIKEIKDDTRLRLSSLEPDYIDDKFFTVIKDFHIFPFFHLPVQSASDVVLKYAGRHYTKEKLSVIIDKLKSSVQNPYIAFDVITGLPKENDREAEETYNFIKEKQISALHVFPFSPRKKTKFENEKHAPERVRDERALALRELSKELYTKFIDKNIGQSLEGITLKEDDKNFVITSNYIKAEYPFKAIDGSLVKGVLLRDKNSLVLKP